MADIDNVKNCFEENRTGASHNVPFRSLLRTDCPRPQCGISLTIVNHGGDLKGLFAFDPFGYYGFREAFSISRGRAFILPERGFESFGFDSRCNDGGLKDRLRISKTLF